MIVLNVYLNRQFYNFLITMTEGQILEHSRWVLMIEFPCEEERGIYVARAEKQEPSSIWLGRGGVVIETWALGFCSDSPLSGEVEFSMAKGLKARTWLGGGGVVIETWGLMAGSEVRLDWQEGGSPASASVPTLPNTKRFVIKKQN